MQYRQLSSHQNGTRIHSVRWGDLYIQFAASDLRKNCWTIKLRYPESAISSLIHQLICCLVQNCVWRLVIDFKSDFPLRVAAHHCNRRSLFPSNWPWFCSITLQWPGCWFLRWLQLVYSLCLTKILFNNIFLLLSLLISLSLKSVVLTLTTSSKILLTVWRRELDDPKWCLCVPEFLTLRM